MAESGRGHHDTKIFNPWNLACTGGSILGSRREAQKVSIAELDVGKPTGRFINTDDSYDWRRSVENAES